MAIADTVRMEIEWHDSGTPQALNVMHLRKSPGILIDQDAVDFLGAHVENAYIGPSGWLTRVADTWTLQRINVQDLSEDGLDVLSAEIAQPGTDPAEQLPDMSAIVITLRSNGGNNGRTFFPGASETQNALNGRPSIQAVDAAEFTAEFLRAGFPIGPNSEFQSLAVLHRQVPVDDSFTTDVTAVARSASSAGFGWQTQRRRRTPLTAF